MKQGIVVGLQARIGIIFRFEGRSDIEIEFVIDTGFEGFLTLPPATIAELGLPYFAKINANLADNSTIATNVHAATIIWNGRERDIVILAMGRRPLLGTALLEDSHLGIDFQDGGTVLIDEIW